MDQRACIYMWLCVLCVIAISFHFHVSLYSHRFSICTYTPETRSWPCCKAFIHKPILMHVSPRERTPTIKLASDFYVSFAHSRTQASSTHRKKFKKTSKTIRANIDLCHKYDFFFSSFSSFYFDLLKIYAKKFHSMQRIFYEFVFIQYLDSRMQIL